MKPTKEPRKINYDNYYWGILAFFVPIIGALLLFYWAGKYPKAIKGIAVGLFLLCVIVLLLGVFYHG